MRGFILDWQSYPLLETEIPSRSCVCMDFNQFLSVFKVIHRVLAILNLVLSLLHSLLDIPSCFGNTRLVVVCYGSVLLACDIHGLYKNKLAILK